MRKYTAPAMRRHVESIMRQLANDDVIIPSQVRSSRYCVTYRGYHLPPSYVSKLAEAWRQQEEAGLSTRVTLNADAL